MAKSMTINITKDLINEATTADSSKCMIAQAIRRRGGHSVAVTAESASFNIGKTRYTYPLPAKAAIELLKFDKSKKTVKPFSFILQGPLAFSRPVIKPPVGKKRGPTRARRKHKLEAKRCKRRFHGLRVIEERTA